MDQMWPLKAMTEASEPPIRSVVIHFIETHILVPSYFLQT